MRIEDYLVSIVESAVDTFGELLVGVYTTGSLALDDFVPGRSDVDVLVVAEDVTPEAARVAFAEAVSHPRLRCPATGLELSVICRSAAGAHDVRAGYLLELNTGPELPPLLSLEAERPQMWFAIDRAIARQSGQALFGPPAAEVIAALPRVAALQVLAESLRYQREHLGDWLADSIVLNACRALAFVVQDRWLSKPAAGAWALGQTGVPDRLVELALHSHAHLGRAGAAGIPLEPAHTFVSAVIDRLDSLLQ